MRSTFHGLEVSKRGLIAQQAALNTTGHNIANANTEGYTRQRVNMVATTGIPYVGLNMSREAGLLGTGVMVSDIQRLREDFLDLQYRNENKILGYWDERVDALAKIEAILQEPSETGLQKVMDQMWQAWQDLSKDPINPSTRAVVRERSIAVAETFANLYRQLQQVQQDMDHVVGVKALEVNSLAQQIAAVNKMINDVVPHGYVPNDLYDQRDVLIDKLSKLVPVKVSYVENGMVDIQVDGRDLVNGYTSVPVAAVRNPQTGLNEFTIGGVSFKPTSGAITAILESRDVLIPGTMERLDLLAINLTREINNVHKLGYSINDINAGGGSSQIPFFVDRISGGTADPTGAANIAINPAILASLDAIAAARPEPDGSVVAGNNENALAIAQIKFKIIPAGAGPTDFKEATTLDDYYRYTIGELGVKGQEAIRNQKNSETIVNMVAAQRESVSGVSIDEEMSNLVKYQHAYNAAARSITAVDEILDRIINGMGRVGL
ncbi:flagellar hook-associated protein FlgK [Brevibacillus sedimenti]|jgi:flagellar hook-associated protein 1|uniref:flagellar hook-associated protein FlgK n=1 Tax=Brevibacillus sedimenti TaxID=2613334 RepID=UPI001E53CF05|nr:flagellar hook-associated protein FlgK [Anoxybacillus sediminis]UFJ61953.1 flagellar hook-associated protein FlgK [Anoxybacillus sediminis]